MNDDARVNMDSLKARILALPSAQAEELRALLTGAPKAVPPSPAPTGLAPDPEAVLRMMDRMNRIRRKSLGLAR
jgi:hypothetical protein